MFKPNQSKSDRVTMKIKDTFNKTINNPDTYQVAYGYYIKSGLFKKTVSSYIIGFNNSTKELVVLPITEQGDAQSAPIYLKQTDISSAKVTLQGETRIKSDKLERELRIIVPPYTATSLESMYVLPIIQEEVSMQFKDFIKNY